MNITEAIQEKIPLLISGSTDYPPYVKKILSEYGNQIIKSIALKRRPVSGLLTGALSLFSTKFGKRMKKSFDELFHLFLEIQLQSGTRILIEKNERINMEINPKERDNIQIKNIEIIPQNMSLNTLLETTRRDMGSQYFAYDAAKNNCQNFILNILKSNNIGTEQDINFIKQDTEELFKGLPILKKTAHFATELAERGNILLSGGSISFDVSGSSSKQKQKQSLAETMFFKHLTSHITDIKDLNDIGDFKHAINIIDIIKQLKERKINGYGLKPPKSNIIINVQSVAFLKKNDWNISKARKWLKDRKFKGLTPDMTDYTIRFRQIDPNNYTEFKSHKLNNGIILIFGLSKHGV